MLSRLINTLQSLGYGIKTVSLAALCLAAGIFFTPDVSQAETLIGTEINNIANISFSPNGIPVILTEESNLHSFKVESRYPDNTIEMTVTGVDSANVFPGSELFMDINLDNLGGNDLLNGRLTLTLPNEVTLSIEDDTVTLLEQRQLGNEINIDESQYTLYTFAIPDIKINEDLTIKTKLIFPLDANIYHNLININYAANAQNIEDHEIELNLNARTEAVLDMLRYSEQEAAKLVYISETEYLNNEVYSVIPAPTLEKAQTSVAEQQISTVETSTFSHDQVIFFRLIDGDQNLNSAIRDYIDIKINCSRSDESEQLRLYETDVNSGIFTGYLAQGVGDAKPNDGILDVHTNAKISLSYSDQVDQSEVKIEQILIDPYGRVFDSATGENLDNYTVHMINADTGLPAIVYGDDGISSYPATVVTGASVTDSSGRLYQFDPGSYRFPFAEPGNYQLLVVAPDGSMYRWPSSANNEQISNLPNGPYAITLGSRGETFELVDGPPLHIDIPADPLTTQMFVERSANKDDAAIGDFVQYKVVVENITNVTLDNIVISDELAPGFRLKKETIRLNDEIFNNINIAENGESLTFNIDSLAAGESYTLKYLTVIGSSKRGVAPSTSHAIANHGAANSNTARLNTFVSEELMRNTAVIVGNIMLTDDIPDNEKPGLSGMRIYMEDGRYAITDQRGMYHFENITPGNHVVQLDTTSLPSQYETVLKDDNTRNAGRAFSQFIDIQGGSVWRSDFYIAPLPTPTGKITLQISNETKNENDQLPYQIDIENSNIDLEKIALTVMIPEGTSYTSGSSRLNNLAIADPRVIDNILIYKLGFASKEWHKQLNFKIEGFEGRSLFSADELLSKASLRFNSPSQANQRSDVAEHTINNTTMQATSGSLVTTNTIGLRPGAKAIKGSQDNDLPKATETVYDGIWLSQQDPGIEWMLPKKNAQPEMPNTNISIKHHIKQNVVIYINGEQLSGSFLDGIIRNVKGQALSQWKGVHLIEGDNLLEAVVMDMDDNEVSRMQRSIHYSSHPANAELIAEKSVLLADGATAPVIAIRFTDKFGFPARKGINGQFLINSPYQLKNDSKFDIEKMTAAVTSQNHYVIGDDGIAYIKLEPTLETGFVKITPIMAEDSSKEIKAKLKPVAREWILVGIAEGMAGYTEISENLEDLDNNEKAETELEHEGRVAFYAKGKVKGDWLLSIAYDSERDSAKDADPELFQAIDPNKYYSVYGDDSQTGFGASSSDKLYLKLENDEFFFLYGDYQTDISHSELAKYNRSFTGMKSRYNDDRYDVIVFAAETNLSYYKDEFRGDGSIGPFQLSQTEIALNSETIIIEVRNRYRSEEILLSQSLTRHIDYTIDYETGLITFRKPIYSIDLGLNPQFIIANYETYNEQNESLTYGGRAEALVTDSLKVGITHINEGKSGGEAIVDGLDVDYQLNKNTRIKLESARSEESNVTTNPVSGSAYIAEIEHNAKRVSGKIYMREQEGNFGLGQTNASETATHKTGIEANINATARLQVKTQAYRQQNTSNDTKEEMIEASAKYNLSSAAIGLGYRTSKDTQASGDSNTANQITSNASKNFFDRKLQTRIEHEHNLSSGQTLDYPDKTRLGLDYQLSNITSLFLEQELANGETTKTLTTLMGVRSTPWQGGTIYTGINKISGNNDNNTNASVALQQTWLINENWSMDFGAEQSKTLQTQAGGSTGDFTATSVAATYKQEDWIWTTNIGNHDSNTEQRWSTSTSIQTNPQANLSVLLNLDLGNSQQTNGDKQNNTSTAMGLAYRPQNSRWIILDKLELRFNDDKGTEFDSKSHSVINIFNANYKYKQWQLSLQYAAKNIKETIDNIQYDNFVDLVGFESRYDLTEKWDLGMHGNILRSQDLDHYDYNTGVSIGHAVAKNTWISLGYNFTGFRDQGFSRSNHTSEGAFLRFRMKFDQTTVRDAVKWIGQ